MIAVDTNILVYAHRADSVWHVRAVELVRGLVDAGLGRHDVVVALGGGVVGDLAGLVAAVFMVKQGRLEAHRKLMLAAFATSAALVPSRKDWSISACFDSSKRRCASARK